MPWATVREPGLPGDRSHTCTYGLIQSGARARAPGPPISSLPVRWEEPVSSLLVTECLRAKRRMSQSPRARPASGFRGSQSLSKPRQPWAEQTLVLRDLLAPSPLLSLSSPLALQREPERDGVGGETQQPIAARAAQGICTWCNQSPLHTLLNWPLLPPPLLLCPATAERRF